MFSNFCKALNTWWRGTLAVVVMAVERVVEVLMMLVLMVLVLWPQW